MTTPATDPREVAILQQRIASMLTQAATWLGTLYGMTGNVAAWDDAQTERDMADRYRAPIAPDWRFDHEDERSG